ncbi:MAG: ABC transporter ATP-binding protein [Spirochaetaceae bacterium]
MIEFDGVVKNYGEHRALDGVSFTVPDGCVTVLIGPSGCGKSTSLKLVNRLLEPDDGYIRVNDRPVKSFAVEELRRGIGYVIQSVGLLPHMTVKQNIGLVPRLLGRDKAWRADRAYELLSLIGLDPDVYADKYPSQLSGGEAQRVGVARALAADPPILLMDEPFGAVDPLNRETLQNEFISLQKKLKKTVIFVTHDLDEAVRVADRIVLMQEGLVVQEASPEHLLGGPDNDFVREFVGSDRALKRLGRFIVADYMESLDAGEKPSDTTRDSVLPDATLREALSRILAIPDERIAVVDSAQRTVGFITLKDIQRAACRQESS